MLYYKYRIQKPNIDINMKMKAFYYITYVEEEKHEKNDDVD